MTLPSIDSVDTLGGVLTNPEPVLDPTTELDADADNKTRANVAMMTHTVPQAVRRFVGHATTPADPSSGFVHDALWGNANADKATVTRSGAGIYLATWPGTVQDELEVEQSLNFRYARAWVEIAGATCYSASARVTAANVVEIRVFTSAGVLNDAAGFNIVVQVY